MPQFTTNNVASNTGDVLIVTFTDSFKDIQSVDSFKDTVTTESTDKYFEREFRWSNDGLSYSSWLDVGYTGATTSNWGSTELNAVVLDGCDDIWFELRYTRAGATSAGDLTLNSSDLNFTSCNTEEVSPPGSCSCNNPNYCEGITIKCDSDLWNPYSIDKKALCLYGQINQGINDIFGHCVKYFKTIPKKNSRDVILKEYTLFDVSAIKDIKILVPNNEFPEEDLQYGPYDIGFNEPFEVHIIKEEFERAFGQNRRPEQRDYLYFPLMDRMWEVSSGVKAKTFQQDSNYYKVQLFKWQDKVNVVRGATADQIVEDLTLDIDEVFKDERDEEFQKVTKPLQYNTISTGAYDFIRSEMNTELKIIDDDINNYWTVVAKYYYKLNSIPLNEIAVKYKELSKIPSGEDRAYTGWFIDNRSWVAGSTATSVPVFDGHDSTNGIKMNATYDTSAKIINGFDVTIGATTHNLNATFPTLSANKWYAFALNISNTHGELSLNLWEMEYDPIQYNQSPSTSQTTDLKLIFSQSITGMSFDEITTKYYQINGSTIGLTNIRVLKKVIEEDKQPLFLNQYVVKDNHLAILVDNALPQLRYGREDIR